MRQIVLMWIALLPLTEVMAGESAEKNRDLLTSSARAEQTAPDQKAIVELYAQWRKAVETANIPAYISVLHKDVRLIPPGAQVIAGAHNYQQFLGPVFESASYRIDVAEHPRIDVLGDIAVAEYAYVIHLKLHDSDSGIEQPGALTASRTEARYLDVLRKNAAGQWKVWRHTWH